MDRMYLLPKRLQQKNIRFLMVTNEFPLPPHSGARVHILNRLKTIKTLGYNVDIICFNQQYIYEEELDKLKQLADYVWLPKRRPVLLSSFHWLPAQIISRMLSPKYLIEILNYYLSSVKNEYIIVLSEGLYVFPTALKIAKKLNTLVVLSIENFETSYYYNTFKSCKGIKKLHYFLEYKKFEAVESYLIKKADFIWAVSKDESLALLEQVQPKEVEWVPSLLFDNDIEKRICMLEKKVLSFQKFKTINVLFVGALDMPVNIEAVLWLLEKVWIPHLKSDCRFRLTIAGRNPSKKISNLCAMAGAELCYNVPDMTPYYTNAHIFVNPVKRGAGVNVKILEAASNGVPIISSSIGIRGTGFNPGTHLYIANTPFEFVKSLNEIYDDYNSAILRARLALDFIKKHYSIQRLDYALSKSISNLVKIIDE